MDDWADQPTSVCLLVVMLLDVLVLRILMGCGSKAGGVVVEIRTIILHIHSEWSRVNTSLT
jgi:hypothetical protein